MSRPVVRCRCGHQVLAKEVLRTDLYERSSGRDYVYVKFRCKRCKRLGEAFVAEHRWDWNIFEPAGEISDAERDQLSTQAPISVAELIDFHRQLQRTITIDQLESTGTDTTEQNQSTDAAPGDSASGSPLRQKSQDAHAKDANEPLPPEDLSSAAT